MLAIGYRWIIQLNSVCLSGLFGVFVRLRKNSLDIAKNMFAISRCPRLS